LAGLALFAGLLLAFSLGSAAGAPQPPNLTGTWTRSDGGTFSLTASGTGLTHLHAEWHGTAASGHPKLFGVFDGSLNSAGDAYSGSLAITEGDVHVAGTMTFHIDSPNKLTVTYSQANGVGGTIVMTRSGGTSTPPESSKTVSVSSFSGEVTVRRNGGPWEPLTSGRRLEAGDEIFTAVDSRAVLKFEDGSTLEVRELSQLLAHTVLVTENRRDVEVQLKLGEIKAQVKKEKAVDTTFEIRRGFGRIPGTDEEFGDASVRGTVFTVFADPVGKAVIVSTQRGVVAVTPKRNTKPVLVPAGKEVEVTAAGASPLAPIGKAGARGGVNRLKARDLVLAVIDRSVAACQLGAPRMAAGVKPAGAAAWTVSVTVQGNVKGVSLWRVGGGRVSPLNTLAKTIAAGCKGSSGATAIHPSVTFTQNGTAVGQAIVAPTTADGLAANMDPHTGVIANAYWTRGGKSLGAVAVPAGATGLVFRTAPSASPGTPLTRPSAATSFHVGWNAGGVITSAGWFSVGKPLATIPVTSGQEAIAFTNSTS
jgi:hypothetical protein